MRTAARAGAAGSQDRPKRSGPPGARTVHSARRPIVGRPMALPSVTAATAGRPPLTRLRPRRSVAPMIRARAAPLLAIALYVLLVFASFHPAIAAAAGHDRLRRRLAGERVHRGLERAPALPRARASLRRQRPLPAPAGARVHRPPAAALAGRRARPLGDGEPRPGHQRRRRPGLPAGRLRRTAAGPRARPARRWRPGPRAPSTRSTPTRSTRRRASTSSPTASCPSPWPS